MTTEQFNEKYKEYLGENHYGLDFEHPQAIEMLDKEFEELIKRPGFKYYQIKLKFGMARFYADAITNDEMYRIEDQINNLLKG
jgi:hypothetical protein